MPNPRLPDSQVLQIMLDSFCVGYEGAPDLDGHTCSAPLQDADQARMLVVIDNTTYSITARKEFDGAFWAQPSTDAADEEQDVAEGNRPADASAEIDDAISEAQMIDEAQHFRSDT